MATFKIKYTLTFIRNPIYPIKIEFQQTQKKEKHYGHTGFYVLT